MADARRMLGCCRRRKLSGPGWPPRRCLTDWTGRPASRPVRRSARPAGPTWRWSAGGSAARGPRCWPRSGTRAAAASCWRRTGSAGRRRAATAGSARPASPVVRPTAVRMRPGALAQPGWARDKPPGSSAAGRMPRDMPLATARYAGPEPSQAVPGDGRALQVPELPGHAPERSFRRGTGTQQANRTEARNGGYRARRRRRLPVRRSPTPTTLRCSGLHDYARPMSARNLLFCRW
jgi:hypothetical protein